MKPVWAVCAVFVAVSAIGLDWLGVQTDEALFSGALYPPFPAERVLEIGGVQLPLMVFDYVGSLKAALLAPWIWAFGASVWTVRLPAILIAALALALFAAATRRMGGATAAVIAALLLASDPSFLFTSRLDWGPVALQHLTKAFALYAGCRFWQSRRLPWLALCGFAVGLGLWDKTLFLWSAAAMAAALVLVHPRGIAARLTARGALVFALGLAVGSAPLLLFQLRTNGRSFRGGWETSMAEFQRKAPIMRTTLDGTVMRGLFTLEHGTPSPRWLALVPGSALLVLFAAALPACLGGCPRTALFAFAAWLLTWLAMLVTRDGGASVHHTVLAYPFPHLFIALVAARWIVAGRVRRAAASVAVAITVLTAGVVCAQYFWLERNWGGNAQWSDAFHGMNRELARRPQAEVVLLDWGFYDNTRLFQQGGKSFWVPGALESMEEKDEALGHLSRGDSVFVRHLAGWEIAEGQAERFLQFARDSGYRVADPAVIRDRLGRPVIEVFRVAR